MRWELQERAPGMEIDPHYKILIGRIYDMVRSEYPFHEQLPTATIPDEIAGYVVQHRFRKDKARGAPSRSNQRRWEGTTLARAARVKNTRIVAGSKP